MKNMGKFLGIIALLVIIGLAAGCEQEAEPDDQIIIIVTGLPDGANGKSAIMGIFETNPKEDTNAVTKAVSSAPKTIAGNQAETAMNFADGGKNNGKAFGEKGNYYIMLAIYADYPSSDSVADPLYYGISDRQTLEKGANRVAINKFDPEPTAANFPAPPPTTTPDTPTANDYGTYTTTYTATAGQVTETVVLSATQFKISDNSGGRTGDAADHLTFKIESWESTTVPTNYSDYTGAYKFTGRILDQLNYVPSLKTAPETSGFSTANNATDVKADETGTVCWMYIYFKGTTGNITFIRSAFSRTGSTENKAVVTNNDNSPRVFTKQP